MSYTNTGFLPWYGHQGNTRLCKPLVPPGSMSLKSKFVKTLDLVHDFNEMEVVDSYRNNFFNWKIDYF